MSDNVFASENEYPEPPSDEDGEISDHVDNPKNEGRSDDSQEEESDEENRHTAPIDSTYQKNDDNNPAFYDSRSIAAEHAFPQDFDEVDAAQYPPAAGRHSGADSSGCRPLTQGPETAWGSVVQRWPFVDGCSFWSITAAIPPTDGLSNPSPDQFDPKPTSDDVELCLFLG